MTDFQYGPVEIYLIGFDGDRPSERVASVILDLVEAGTVRLLDLLFVSRPSDDQLVVLELEDVVDEFGLESLEIAEAGLTGQEDIEDLGTGIQPGTSAAILVVEHAWAREFAQVLYDAGGRVLQTHQIAAPVVNQMVAVTRA